MLRSNGAIIERRWVIIAGIVVLAILVLGLARETLQGWVDVFLEFVEALGPLGPILLLIADFLAVVMAFPLSIAFELAAGFLFGTFLGCDSDKEERRTTRTLTALLGSFSTIIIALAKVGGACVSFMLGRYFLRNWVEGMLSNSERFNKVYGSMKVDSFRIAILLRLSPFPPSWVNNYALAISPISFKDFFLATLFASIPTIVANVYMGSLMGSIASSQPADGSNMWLRYTTGLVGLVAMIVVIRYVVKYAQVALQETPGKEHASSAAWSVPDSPARPRAVSYL